MRHGTALAPIAEPLRERYSDVMASRKKAPKVTDILLEIRDEIRQTNSKVDANTASIAALTTRFDDSSRVTVARFESLENAMTQGFTHLGERIDRVGARLDNLRDFSGGSFRDHEARIRELERRAGVRRPDDE